MDATEEQALRAYSRGAKPAVSLTYPAFLHHQDADASVADDAAPDVLRAVRDALIRIASKDELDQVQRDLHRYLQQLSVYVDQSQHAITTFTVSNHTITELLQQIQGTVTVLNTYLSTLHANADLERKVLLQLYEKLKATSP